MANIKSARKRVRVNELKRERNVSVKSRMKTHIRRAEEAIQKNDPDSVSEELPRALSHIDRAASKGVIHRNSASRKKANLQRQANTIQQ